MISDNFSAGFLSGISQTIIGHPFDTLKTLKQNNIQLKQISLYNLYRGVSMPIIQTPLIVGIGFYTNELIKPHTNNCFISGMASGIVGSFLVCPFEFYKINLQQQNHIKLNAKDWIRSYRHLNLVLMREVPAMTLYFGIYEKMKEYKFSSFISGGISGVSSWFFTYPLDTIKTRVQGGICGNISKAYSKGNLWIGLNYCLFRAFLVNGVGFTTYEYYS